MTLSASIIDFERFRRAGAALSMRGRPNVPERDEPKAVDWHLPGFGGKARISTIFGDLPIEALRVRDDVRTYSGATARIQSIDKIHLDEEFLRKHSSALPILIRANSFGPGKPIRDLAVSPGQEICLDTHVASFFEKAKNLRDRFSRDLTQSAGLTYYRFHCGQSTVLRVDGVWVRVQP